MGHLAILRTDWERYVIIPTDISSKFNRIEWQYIDCTKSYIDKLQDSMRIEGFCNEDGTLEFSKDYKASDFLTAYRPFFNDKFLDLVIHKAFLINSENELTKNILQMYLNKEFDSEIYNLIFR